MEGRLRALFRVLRGIKVWGPPWAGLGWSSRGLNRRFGVWVLFFEFFARVYIAFLGYTWDTLPIYYLSYHCTTYNL